MLFEKALEIITCILDAEQPAWKRAALLALLVELLVELLVALLVELLVDLLVGSGVRFPVGRSLSSSGDSGSVMIRLLVSSQGTVSTRPVSTSSRRRAISWDHASSTSSSIPASSRLSMREPAIAARAGQLVQLPQAVALTSPA